MGQKKEEEAAADLFYWDLRDYLHAADGFGIKGKESKRGRREKHELFYGKCGHADGFRI